MVQGCISPFCFRRPLFLLHGEIWFCFSRHCFIYSIPKTCICSFICSLLSHYIVCFVCSLNILHIHPLKNKQSFHQLTFPSSLRIFCQVQLQLQLQLELSWPKFYFVQPTTQPSKGRVDFQFFSRIYLSFCTYPPMTIIFSIVYLKMSVRIWSTPTMTLYSMNYPIPAKIEIVDILSLLLFIFLYLGANE